MIISQRVLSIFLVVLIFLTGLTYFYRNPTGDDAWFAEQSYWLHKDGIIRSEFFRGILGWEKQLFASHKLFLAFGALLFDLFGYHLPVIQFVGLIPFCVLIGELCFYIYQKEHRLNSWHLIFSLVLVFSNGLLVKMSFENRPELLVSALGFGSFLCIHQAKKNNMKIIAAAILAGMAMLCHLNGVIFLIAGFFVLVYQRYYKQAFLFAIAGGATGLLYFLDVFLATDGLARWYYQFSNDPATRDAFGWKSKLLVMLTYPEMFFESPEQAALTIVFVYILIKQRKFVKTLPKLVKTYSLTVLIAFWLITKDGAGTYMPIFMPFMFVFIYELYKSNSFKDVGFQFVLAVYFSIGLYGIIEIIYKNFSQEYLPVAYEKLRPYLPSKKSGLVPLTFFFNEYDRYSHLLSSENYVHNSTTTNDPSAQMAGWAHQHKADFILMDYQFRPEYFYPEPGKPSLPYYKLTYFDKRFAIYKANVK
ncbi:hypothetical protein [Spirosoma foliorum]|uniref:Glycosyltransferase RgtA/B/C/D-like domain-containing protein n=1 Tax=Spirosoma foliorum TaxID=2710596 RepID=A0A7G5GSV6_9BACT|nr:hypothetical protein [Spirosoma foliorum]QMW01948.1 hypothetical protein H3H32_29045 [Spirosoma foliorum]